MKGCLDSQGLAAIGIRSVRSETAECTRTWVSSGSLYEDALLAFFLADPAVGVEERFRLLAAVAEAMARDSLWDWDFSAFFG